MKVDLMCLNVNDPDQVGWMYKVRTHPKVAELFFAPPPATFFAHVQFLEQSQQERQFWIVYAHSDMAGYCQVIDRPQGPEVGIALHPDFWRRGIGEIAMRSLMELVEKKYADRAHVMTLVVKKENLRAIGLYRKLGFVVISEEQGQIKMGATLTCST